MNIYQRYQAYFDAVSERTALNKLAGQHLDEKLGDKNCPSQLSLNQQNLVLSLMINPNSIEI